MGCTFVSRKETKYNPKIFTTMRKMLVLSLVLSAMAIGSAMANDVNSADARGPRKVNVVLNVPPCNCHAHHAHPAHPHREVCRECPPRRGHNHSHACKPHRPAPNFNHKGAPAKPHGNFGKPAPGKPAPGKPAPGKPGNGPAPRR